MSLAKYRTSAYTVQPHPQGEYYRVTDVEPLLQGYIEMLHYVYACERKSGSALGDKAKRLLAQLKETP